MDLEELRKRIDDIDEKLLELLRARGRLAEKIAKVKEQDNSAHYVPSREKQVLDRILSMDASPLYRQSVRAIYEQIIAACRVLESPLAISYLGPEGTFCNIAAVRKFGPGATLVPLSSIDEIFVMVEKKTANYGVVPVENSIAGVERTTLDRFVNSPVRICAESYVDIQHNLLSNSPMEKIAKVYSHPQALDQCQAWLRANLPGAELVEVSSTARAAQLAAGEAGAAGIGTELASSIYDLPIVSSGIQDRADNRTRFLIIGREETTPSGKDKTSIIFAVPHRAGSLWESLGVFERHKINMTMIESRPTKQTHWEYLFFADVQGHHSEEPLATALKDLSKEALFVKVLGSYPEAD